jgi:hypothetical protein
MAKPNYGFDKRQRELAKKKKKEEKRQLKAASVPAPGENPEMETEAAAQIEPEGGEDSGA